MKRLRATLILSLSCLLLLPIGRFAQGQLAGQEPLGSDAGAGRVEFGFVQAIWTAGLAEQLVMALLLGFSLLSWAIMIQKWRSLGRCKVASKRFLQMFWAAEHLETVYNQSQQLQASPLAQIFQAGYTELIRGQQQKNQSQAQGQLQGYPMQLGQLESIERAMQRASVAAATELESLLSFLATTGSTAPFIGLLGTVLGIVGAFRDIGMAGNASLATVAPSIGGALVATAFGLIAAIPAVMAYNYFVAQLKTVDGEMKMFGADFLNILKRYLG